MFQHYVTADRVTQYQQQCRHEATIERGLTGGRTAQLAIVQIAMAAIARSFAAAWRPLHTSRPADLT